MTQLNFDGSNLKSSALPLIGISGLYCIIAILTFHYIEEDAYIYFRFAANIAEGHGYVFNQAGPPVESGSSLIWQLLLVPIYFLDPEMVISTKLMGVFFGILCLIMTQKTTGCFVNSQALSHIPSLWLACSYPFYMWSHLGLETPLFLFLSLCFLYCLINESLIRYWPVLAALVVFSRPEGFMLCAMVTALLFKKAGHKLELKQVGLFMLLVGMVELFRLLYFHDLVPHSFYHKMKVQDKNIWPILRNFFKYSLICMPLVLAVPALFRRSLYHYKSSVLIIAVLVALMWGPLGVDIKQFDRSFFVLTPLLYILIIYAIENFISTTNKRLSFSLGVLLLFSLVMLFFAKTNTGRKTYENPLIKSSQLIMAQPYSLKEQFFHLLTPREHLTRDAQFILRGQLYFIYDHHQAISGEFIALNYPEGIRVVYDQMGQTPWYAGLDKHFIDSMGLVDKPIGYYEFGKKLKRSDFLSLFDTLSTPVIRLFGGEERSRWTQQAALNYLFEQKPEVIMLHSFVVLALPESIPGLLYTDERLKKYYTKKYTVNLTAVYERKDISWDRGGVKYPKNCICNEISEQKP